MSRKDEPMDIFGVITQQEKFGDIYRIKVALTRYAQQKEGTFYFDKPIQTSKGKSTNFFIVIRSFELRKLGGKDACFITRCMVVDSGPITEYVEGETATIASNIPN